MFTDDANVASGTKNYTYTVTMLSTTKANNYNLSTTTQTGTNGTISKATAPSNVSHSLSFLAGTGGSKDANLTSLLPTQTSPISYGTVTYTVGTITDTNSIITAPTAGNTPSSPLTVTVASTAADTNTATIPVTVSSTNIADFTITINVSVSNEVKEDTPTAAIDYVAEKLTGLTASAVYKIGGTEYTADASGKIDIVSVWFNTSISIVKKGITATPTVDSDAQTLPIPARPAAPSPGKTDTTGGNSNGSITGVDTTMEYKLSSASTWTACPGTSVTGLAAGTYNVRVKAVASASFASTAASVTIASSSSGNGGGNGGGGGGSPSTPAPDPTPAPPTSNVIVDGKEVNAGEVKTSGDTTTVTVNQDTINKQLENATNNVTVVVPNETGTAVAQLVVQNVDDMAAKDMSLTVQVGNVQYEIPTTAIDTSSILATLGANNAADVPISITITTDMSASAQAAVDKAIASSGGELVIPPMEFKITATYNGKTVEIDAFSAYVGI